MQTADQTELRLLAERFAAIKETQKTLEQEINEIIPRLEAGAQFKDGSKTGHLSVPGFKVKVEQKENISWDQEKLQIARAKLGDEAFHALFKAEYKPVSSAVLKAAPEELKKMLAWASEVKPAKPYVTYERIKEEPTNGA